MARRQYSGNREKTVVISSDTQLYLTTVHSRETEKDKRKKKRFFSLVINGLLISTTLVSSVILTGCNDNKGVANPTPTEDPNKNIQNPIERGQDEVAMLSNLNMATKMIKAAMEKNEWAPSMFENLTKRIASIEAKIQVDGKFTNNEDLVKAIIDADRAVSGSAITMAVKDYQEVVDKREESLKALNRIKDATGETKGINNKVIIGMLEDGVSDIKKAQDSNDLAKANTAKFTYANEKLSKAIQGGNITIDDALKNAVKDAFDKVAEIGKTTNGDEKADFTIGATLIILNDMKRNLGIGTAENKETPKEVANNDTTGGNSAEKLIIPGPSKDTGSKDSGGSNNKQTNNTSKQNTNNNSSSKQNTNNNTSKPATNTGGSSGGSSSSGGNSGSTVKQGIKTLYGTHDYACANQSEYDTVMSKVKGYTNNLESIQLSQYVKMYFDGKRHTDFAEDTEEYKGLLSVRKSAGYFIEKVPRADAERVMKGRFIAFKLREGAPDSKTYEPRSAFDAIVRQISDCDSDAQVDIAVLDALGYSTCIVEGNNHADAYVKVNGIWWNVTGLSPVSSLPGSILVGPTY